MVRNIRNCKTYCAYIISAFALSKDLGRHKLAMSCTYSFSEMILLMLFVFPFLLLPVYWYALNYDSTLYLYIFGGKTAVYLKLNIISYIPGSKRESIQYPWK